MAETAAQRQAHQKYRSGQKNLSIALRLMNYTYLIIWSDNL